MTDFQDQYDTYMHGEKKKKMDKQRKGKGCLFYGCLTIFILLLIIGGCTAVTMYVAVKTAKEYTSTEPVELARYEPQPMECDTLMARVNGFKQAMKEDRAARLVLSADDLNGFVSCDPDMKEAAGKVYFYIVGDELSAKTSIPLGKIPGLSGRFLNGTVGVSMFLKNGVLYANATKIEVDGKPIPDAFMQGLQQENLAKDLMANPEIGPVIRKLKRLEITEGRLVIER